jgi:hypothetical protein
VAVFTHAICAMACFCALDSAGQPPFFANVHVRSDRSLGAPALAAGELLCLFGQLKQTAERLVNRFRGGECFGNLRSE